LPAALLFDAGFSPAAYGTRRQLRMYAQIFSSARKKFEKLYDVTQEFGCKSGGSRLDFHL
jgi:hypothetical protein